MSPATSTSLQQWLDNQAWYGQRRPVFSGGNELRLLRGGDAQFPAMCDAIDQAVESVWLASYIISPQGGVGPVLQALRRAAQRGVDVHVVADGVGSRDTPTQVWDELRSAGVQFVIYRPVQGVLRSFFQPRQWRRMHMKLCVVDDRVAFVGGINLIDDRYDLTHGWSDTPRLDYAVCIQGPTVMPVAHTTRAIWTRAAIGRDWRDDMVMWLGEKDRVKRMRLLWHQMRLTPPLLATSSRQQQARPAICSAFVLRDNLLQRRTIERVFRRALASARTQVDIVTPYFYPGLALRLALQQAAARGVKVRLLLQGKIDYPIAGLAARVLYEELQHHGVHIHEYQPAFLHGKVVCIDGHWASVGSSNLDPLSLLLNLEANILVDDTGFAARLQAELDKDFSFSHEVPAPSKRNRSWRQHLTRSFVAACANLYLRLGGIRKRY